MKTIGMLGGMSWQSTALYYREINEGIKEKLGALHSAEIILNSVDFEKIERLQQKGDWEATADILGKSARSVGTLVFPKNTAPAALKRLTARPSLFE